MAELAKEFQLMTEFQRLRERSHSFLLKYQERVMDDPTQLGLSLEDVTHAIKSTSEACFDLLMRQEHEWQARIQQLEDDWEGKAQGQTARWKELNSIKDRQHQELRHQQEQLYTTSVARIEQLESLLNEQP